MIEMVPERRLDPDMPDTSMVATTLLILLIREAGPDTVIFSGFTVMVPIS